MKQKTLQAGKNDRRPEIYKNDDLSKNEQQVQRTLRFEARKYR